MEEKKNQPSWLDLINQPGFCVKDNVITQCNAAARQLMISPGSDITPMLVSGSGEYDALTGGCLYLTLNLGGLPIGATVTRMEDMDIFLLHTEESPALCAMGLAARDLRRPLASALSDVTTLLEAPQTPEVLKILSDLNRSLYRILRLLGNMTDAQDFTAGSRMQTVQATAFFRDLFTQAQELLAQAEITLDYRDCPEDIYCMMDKQLLERAVWNLLSNAAKFTPKGGCILVSLVRRGDVLQLTMEDTGSGIAESVLGTLFQRYLRQPGLEDSRFGMGLGLRMIRSAAAAHGGTLLLSSGSLGGTRATMTISIRQQEQCSLHGPMFGFDYTGGFDHALVELSDCLPNSLYDQAP